jgi:hypothetical protein
VNAAEFRPDATSFWFAILLRDPGNSRKCTTRFDQDPEYIVAALLKAIADLPEMAS